MAMRYQSAQWYDVKISYDITYTRKMALSSGKNVNSTIKLASKNQTDQSDNKTGSEGQ